MSTHSSLLLLTTLSLAAMQQEQFTEHGFSGLATDLAYNIGMLPGELQARIIKLEDYAFPAARAVQRKQEKLCLYRSARQQYSAYKALLGRLGNNWRLVECETYLEAYPAAAKTTKFIQQHVKTHVTTVSDKLPEKRRMFPYPARELITNVQLQCYAQENRNRLTALRRKHTCRSQLVACKAAERAIAPLTSNEFVLRHGLPALEAIFDTYGKAAAKKYFSDSGL